MEHTHCMNCGKPLSDPVSVREGYGPDCRALGKTQEARERQDDLFTDGGPHFTWKLVRGCLVITDQDLGGRSVTNAIQEVLQQIWQEAGAVHPGPVIYRDSQGVYDQVHTTPAGNFDHFSSIGMTNGPDAVKAALGEAA